MSERTAKRERARRGIGEAEAIMQADKPSDALPRGLFAHVGEPRVDVAYWSDPWYMRLYCRLMYATFGALLVAMILDGLGVDGTVQWAIGGLTCVAVLTFRWFRPNGFSDMYAQMMDANQKAMEELKNGDYTGVPTFLVPDKDYERVKAEREAERVTTARKATISKGMGQTDGSGDDAIDSAAGKKKGNGARTGKRGSGRKS